MTYEELLAEELREWRDHSAHFDPHDPEIRETWAGWSARFDDDDRAKVALQPLKSRGRLALAGDASEGNAS